MSDGTDFYEDDEPIENIRAAFKSGEPTMTARPRPDVNQGAGRIVGAIVQSSESDEEPDMAGAVIVGHVAGNAFSSNRIVRRRTYAGSVGRL